MRASSSERISSRSTSVSELAIGIVKPSFTGVRSLPGKTCTYMSFSPVRGRSAAFASRRMSVSYSCLMSSPTSARPSLSSTLPMSPISTPATWTVWPWPGVTACAVSSSTLMRIGVSSASGKRKRWLSRM